MNNDYANHLAHMLDGMMTATEPRIVALLPAAFLEAILVELIIAKLPTIRLKLRNRLFDGDGAFSTLAAKIDMAEAVGSVDEKWHSMAILLARVRNTFAHRIDIRDFDHREIVALVQKMAALNTAEVSRIWHQGEWKILTNDNNEGRFINAAISICGKAVSILTGLENFELKQELRDAPGTFRTISFQQSRRSQ